MSEPVRLPRARPTVDKSALLRARRTAVSDNRRVPTDQRVPTSGVVSVSGMDMEEPFVDRLRKAAPEMSRLRIGDRLHVSDLITKCVRKLAIIRRLRIASPATRLRDGEGITYAQGDAIHDYIRGRLISSSPDEVWGNWRCVCGKATIQGVTATAARAQMACRNCGGKLTRYVEESIGDDELPITGSPDIQLLLSGRNAFLIGELKSKTAKLFNDLSRPDPDHVIQVLFYWWLKSRKNVPLADAVAIVYANKEYSFKLPFREYVQNASEQVGKLEPYIQEAREYKAALEGGALPVRRKCTTMEATEAKKCPVCTQCFAME